MPRRVGIGITVILFAIFGMSKVVQGGLEPGYTTLTVGPGQTLWGIVAQRYPDADVRAKIDQVMAANRLRQPVVFPGEKLRVPNQ